MRQESNLNRNDAVKKLRKALLFFFKADILIKKYCNYSTGKRIYCAYRKKMIQEFKYPIAVSDLNRLLHVTMKVMNSYELFIKGR